MTISLPFWRLMSAKIPPNKNPLRQGGDSHTQSTKTGSDSTLRLVAQTALQHVAESKAHVKRSQSGPAWEIRAAVTPPPETKD